MFELLTVCCVSLQAAKSLGASLRGFAPTIRELAGVSNELKQTLEQEIGLDDIRREWRSGSMSSYTSPAKQDQAPSSNRLDPSDNGSNEATVPQPKQVTDDNVLEVDPDIAQKRADAARVAWGEIPNTSHMTEAGQDHGKADQPTANNVDSGIGGMSIEELEAELARRRSKQSSSSGNEA